MVRRHKSTKDSLLLQVMDHDVVSGSDAVGTAVIAGGLELSAAKVYEP